MQQVQHMHNDKSTVILFHDAVGTNLSIVHPQPMAWGEAEKKRSCGPLRISTMGGENQPCWFGRESSIRPNAKDYPPTTCNGKTG